MSQIPDDIDWSLTTWEGARREQLRHWAALTLRERMQSLEDMAEVAERFRQMRETDKLSGARPKPAAAPDSEAHAVRQTRTPYGSNDE